MFTDFIVADRRDGSSHLQMHRDNIVPTPTPPAAPKMLGNLYIAPQAGYMSKKLRTTSLWLIAVLLGLLAANCSKPVPGEKEMLGKIKGKASLRLADGSTISRDDSDEYSPYLIKMDDGFLVLVFGSNRDCGGSCSAGTHNLFVARSLTTFDGVNLPFFATPTVLTYSVTPLNSTSQISYAVKKNGTGLRVFVNLQSDSDNINYGDISNPSTPSVSAWTQAANATNRLYSIIGISGDGSQVFATDSSGIGYAFDPANANAATAFGYGLDNATSATQVRQENSGYDDAILGVYYSSTYAAAGAQYFGPIIDLDTSLALSGLSITNISTFSADDAANDVVLFSAFDYFGGFTQDLYVITSHTSKDLWDSAGFLGFDFLPTTPPPMPNHHFAFESSIWSSCSAGTAIDFGIPSPWASGDCVNVTFNTPSHNFSEFGTFNGTNANLNLGTQTLPSIFTISAWLYLTSPSPSCGSNCFVVANGVASTAYNGFKFYIDTSDMSMHFVTGNGSADATGSTGPGVVTDGAWYHVAAVVNGSLGAGSYVSLYVDGVDVTLASNMEDTFTNNATLRVGTDNDGGYFFGGDMDDVMLFDSELTPSEIAALALSF